MNAGSTTIHDSAWNPTRQKVTQHAYQPFWHQERTPRPVADAQLLLPTVSKETSKFH
ncbi:hypothetical protein PtA15_1A705 [Puccinia triticina]|uniref:Uncharacterized protein n=1 Tax=Puccinia triticina TaxID=208348 RepID=A0ABY7CBW1_9BASI|nr:uncharacterized protein PtA15_1A705 [Puccinia triticina]WAQ81365.1 hypothetical protein PtA15_1A705 [Puccinia triticina]